MASKKVRPRAAKALSEATGVSLPTAAKVLKWCRQNADSTKTPLQRAFSAPLSVLVLVRGEEVGLDHFSPDWDYYRYLGSMGKVSVETRTVPGAGEIAELYIEELEGPDATVPLPRALVAWGQVPSPAERDRDPRPDPPDVW